MDSKHSDCLTAIADTFQILADVWRKAELKGVDEPSKEQVEMAENVLLDIQFGKRPLNESDVVQLKDVTAQLSEALGDEIVAEAMSSYRSGNLPADMIFHEVKGYFPINQEINELFFDVRGPEYLSNQVKVPSPAPLFFLRSMQFLEDASIHRHVAQDPWCALPSHDPCHLWLLVNLIVPGSTFVHVMCIFSASPEAFSVLTSDATADEEGWMRCLRRFWKGDDEDFCNARFKLFPRVVDANWTIKMAVGKKPALIGTKLKIDYFRGDNYMEIDVDIGSSSTAFNILSMVRGVSKYMVMDMGMAVEPTEESDLPERILCQCRMDHMDLNSAPAMEAEA